MAQRLCVVTVGERSHDDQPLTSRDVSGKTTVLVRSNVEPFILGFVVEQELIGDAFVGGVEQGSRNKVSVLQCHFYRVFYSVETDANSIKELLTDQVIVRGILIACCGSVEHDVISTRCQRHRDDTWLCVVFGCEVEAIFVLSNWLEAEGRSGHGSVLKGAIFGGVEVNVHNHIDGFWLCNEFNQ